MDVKNILRWGGLVLAVGVSACQAPSSAPPAALSPSNPIDTASGGDKNGDSNGTPTITPTITPAPSVAPSGVALVFSGNGACTEDCAKAGEDAATLAGLTPVAVYGNELSTKSTAEQIAAFFDNVKVWIMPGGSSRSEVASLSSTMRAALKSFVENGGGYVGWCAGAFSATSIIGTTGVSGLGLIPGNTALYDTSSRQNGYGGSIEKTTWFNGLRYLYLEGGPYFYNLPSSVEVVGRYDDQVSVSAVRTTYGKGRVFLTGTHPEAPSWWWKGTGISDPDGSDQSYAADMIRWAAGLNP